MSYQLLIGDCRQLLPTLEAGSVQTCISSPPYYGLRNYGTAGLKWPAMKYVPMAGLPAVKVPRWVGELGSEPTPEMFVAHLVAIYAEVWRVLASNGTVWVNLGDSYATKPNGPSLAKSKLQVSIAPHAQVRLAHAKRSGKLPAGIKHKDLMMMPARLALALQAAGWYLRQDIVWNKPNAMPEAVNDRCTKSHEFIFLLSKRPKYYYNSKAISEPVSGTANRRASVAALAGKAKRTVPPKSQANEFGVKNNESFSLGTGDLVEQRNKRSVWTVASEPYPGAHFATFPPTLIKPCVLAGSRPGDVVLDIFNGSGTTGEVALQFGRRYIGMDVQADYASLTHERLAKVQLDLFECSKPTRTRPPAPAPVQTALFTLEVESAPPLPVSASFRTSAPAETPPPAIHN